MPAPTTPSRRCRPAPSAMVHAGLLLDVILIMAIPAVGVSAVLILVEVLAARRDRRQRR